MTTSFSPDRSPRAARAGGRGWARGIVVALADKGHDELDAATADRLGRARERLGRLPANEQARISGLLRTLAPFAR